MQIDFSSAIDNARFFAAREAALQRAAQPAVAARPNYCRWCALPPGGQAETRGRAAVPAVNVKPSANGRTAHAH